MGADVNISAVTFDHAGSAFAATVTFADGQPVPCRLRFPAGTSNDIIVPALIRQATEKRRIRPAPLLSRLCDDGELAL